MVLIEWEQLKSLNSEDLGDEDVDRVFSHLTGIQIEDEVDTKKLQQLFKLSQAVMQSKAVQAEVLMEELEKESTNFAKRENQLLDENKGLLQQLQNFQRYDGKENIGRHRSTGISSDMHSLQTAYDRLKLEVQEKETHLMKEKADAEKFLRRLEESEREKRDTLREIANLRDEINDYRHHMESQRESMLSNKGTNVFSTDKLREKNQQINKLLEEIETLEKNNEFLQHRVTDLNLKVEDATNEMNISTSELIRLKDALQKSEKIIDNVNYDNNKLKLRLEETLEKIKQKEITEEKITSKLNERLEDWKVKCRVKDLEIKKYQEKITTLEEKLVTNSVPDETSVNVLSKALTDREEKIKILEEQIIKATSDLNENAIIIERLKTSQPNYSGKNEEKLLKLEIALKKRDEILKDAKRKISEAEADAQEKDSQLIAVLTRMQEYESGEYGLTEAISEIKDVKLQLKTRDKQIQDLTRSINDKDLIVNQLLNKNEELVKRLGADSKQLLHIDQVSENDLIATLQHEVAELEEERILLRYRIRHLAQKTGVKAEDLQTLHKYSATLKSSDDLVDENRHINESMEDELKETRVQLQSVLEDRLKLRHALKEALQDIKHLEDSLAEVLNAIKEQNLSSSLEKLIIESKQKTGSFDIAASMKSQLDIERRKNEELREELETLKKEKEMKIELLDVEDNSKNAQAESLWRVLNLPQNLTLRTGETIAVLNAQLLQVLDDLMIKTKINTDVQNCLNECQLKIDMFRQQTEFLYKEFVDLEKDWRNNYLVLQDSKRKADESCTALEVKVEELEKVEVIYKQDENEVRRRVAEMSGQLINLKSNEAILNRKLLGMKEIETELRNEVKNSREELMAMDSLMLERTHYLRKFKDTSAFQITWLQKSLQESVPVVELEIITKKFEELKRKYLDNCRKQADLSEENIKLQTKVAQLENHLLFEQKERLLLENSLQKELKDLPTNDLLKTMEVQLLNERERNEHLKSLFEQDRQTVNHLNSRNKLLEEKIDELSSIGHEQDLSELFSYKNAHKLIKNLEENESKLTNELTKQKAISKIAVSQVENLITIFKSRNIELESLRQELMELQAGSDEKFLMGQLQRQLTYLKKKDLEANHVINRYKSKVADLEMAKMRLEEKCDEKDLTLQNLQKENHKRIKLLLSALNRIRERYRSGQSFACQEEFAESLIQLRDKEKMKQEELLQAQNERFESEEKLAEYKIRLRSVDELIKTLQDKNSFNKLLEWQETETELRVKEMKIQRENLRLKQTLHKQKSINSHIESKTKTLEEEIIRLTNDMDKREIEWENCLMNRISEEAERGSKIQDRQTGAGQFQNQVKAISRLQNENRNLQKKISTLLSKVNDLEKYLLIKDKKISELQLKISTTNVINNSTEELPKEAEIELEHELFVKNSQIETLQLQLDQKEAMLKHYQSLLHVAQDDIHTSGKRSQTILELLQNKLHSSNDSTLEKFKSIIQQASEKAISQPVLVKTQIQKLEDIVAEQDITFRNLADKLNECQQENNEWKKTVENIQSENLAEKEALIENHETQIREMETVLNQKIEENKIDKIHIAQLNQELKIQVEANELAPSFLQQSQIEKLKELVSQKEKQLQNLSKALTEVKAEFLIVAEKKAEPDFKITELEQKISYLENENSHLRNEKSSLQEEITAMKCEMVPGRQDAGDSTPTHELQDKKYHNVDQSKKDQVVQWTEKKKYQRTIEQLQSKIKDQDKMNEDMEKKIKLLNTVVEKLKLEKKSLEQKNFSKDLPKQTHLKLKKQIDDLLDTKKNLECDLEFSQTEVIYLQDRIGELEELVKCLESAPKAVQLESNDSQPNVTSSRMMQKLQSLQEEITNCHKIISDLRSEKAAMTVEIRNGQEQHLIDRQRMSALEKAVEKLSTENANLTKDFKKECQIRDSLRVREHHLNNDVQRLTKDLSDSIKSHSKLSTDIRYSKLLVLNKTQQQTIDNLEKELKTKSIMLKKTTEQLRESSNHEKVLMTKVSRLKKLPCD